MGTPSSPASSSAHTAGQTAYCVQYVFHDCVIKRDQSHNVTIYRELGTGGMPLLNAALPNNAAKPGERREGEAMVAYPSRMLPLEERVWRRGACAWRLFISGMDFLTRRVWAAIGDVGDK